MDGEFYFRGRVDAQIVNGVLYVPREVKDFYRLKRGYALREEMSGSYKYLAIHPKPELVRDLLREGIASKKLPSEFVPLEKVERKDGKKGLKLPVHSLVHLNIGANSVAKIVGGASSYFEVWKPEDFETYETLVDLESAMSAMAKRSIQPTL